MKGVIKSMKFHFLAIAVLCLLGEMCFAQGPGGTISVKKKKDIGYHYIITPDGDGDSDVFIPNIIEQLDSIPFKFSVFTFESELIYSTRRAEPWDCTQRGPRGISKKVKPGRYLWTVVYPNKYGMDEKVGGPVEVYY